MNRHEFAPLVVPPDARRFLELPENAPYLPSFYTFYRDYCHAAPDHPIVRDINGESYNFSHVVSTKMTRSKQGRSALALRSTDGDHHDRRYRLFIRPFKEDTVAEYDIVETRYSHTKHGFMPHANHSMLYLAVDSENPLRQGVLEVSGDAHFSSLWVIGGNEYLLEDIPYIREPAAESKLLPLPPNIITLPHANPPKAM